jgi:hypothetical protein
MARLQRWLGANELALIPWRAGLAVSSAVDGFCKISPLVSGLRKLISDGEVMMAELELENQ